MNDLAPISRLSLVITNPQALQKGSLPRHIFDAGGGTIGSASASWVLSDREHRVRPLHCRIIFEDGAFVVVDTCGLTRINDHREPIGSNACVALSEGDQLHIGPYLLAVNLHDGSHSLPDGDLHLAQYELDELLSTSDAHLNDGPTQSVQPIDNPSVIEGMAEFQALAAPERPDAALDPLAALEAAEQQRQHANHDALGVLDTRHYGLSPSPPQADFTATRFEAVFGTPKRSTGDSSMSQQDARATAAQSWLHGQPLGEQNPTQLVSPLIQGLDAPLGQLDGPGVYRVQLEAGQALQALIKGLAALHDQQQAGEERRMSVRGRTLQPIEDNPLLLGQGYPETVRALFSNERSVVHLSPAAAVEESLEQLRQQRNAMLKAIEAGLDALLQAFSPTQLQQRFQRYLSSDVEQQGEGDWAWRMFVSYYGELTSARQQGFHKLFWEVFDQHYDRCLRAEPQ
ncbi:type VI secretion system-associated FHA domain protein TagH [Burkholderia sp. Bp8963]|uniref:type VI secretion system-associated FHA domain protein TagH n=1 Tax=Burkholderia sp. Bp8963 TaxID=2184547 RepID=UPI000F5A5E79|nr:type VI secretion system-associated FHA domain protein TagH [Burkholderia sp. Bp8963]RQS75471.1 type VI secretion system-associated FHA domain protein TagH [Burkholderia sp. Bp8963]